MNIDPFDCPSEISTMNKTTDKENLELALICAEDIVDAWPKMTVRTIGAMTNRIETLRQALLAAKK
jgi:hypothetical protein